ncbi:hypothetical protein [Pantoea ananatis]|uniref:hypothetical protein n=1 Tax=Pantoea ananas TaxID=553 RepID=UPI00235000A2|nr:hypothetical protein [Pantoea ananatis]
MKISLVRDSESSERDISIDLLKGLLVIQMVLAHCLQINGTGDFYGISPIANTVSFTGFTFCFGFATWKAYFFEDRRRYKNAIKTSIKCLMAYFISAIYYEVVKQGNGLSTILDIISFKTLAGYSEFLLSFSLIILMPVFFRKIIDIATESELNLLLASAVCSIPTFYHPVNPNPLLGSMIGGNNFSYFPIISYFPIFMAGIYTAKKEKAPLAFCAIALICLIFKLTIYQEQMTRFPPSLWWVTSSFGGFIAYRIIANAILWSNARNIIRALRNIGENVLAYLLLSNILIFTFSRIGYTGRDIKFVLALYIMFMSSISFIINLNNRKSVK